MGVETFIFAGLSLLSARSQVSAANKEAKQVVAEANLKASEKAKELRYRSARVSNSFLNSGVTLEGTPMAALTGIYQTGVDDINAFSNSANRRSKNIVSAARDKAISGLINTAAGASFGGSTGGFGSDLSAGFSSFQGGTGFGTGFDVSNTVRNNQDIF